MIANRFIGVLKIIIFKYGHDEGRLVRPFKNKDNKLVYNEDIKKIKSIDIVTIYY